MCGLDRMIAVDGTHGLVIQHTYLMDLCCKFGEFAIVFHSGFIHRDDLKTLSRMRPRTKSDLVSAPDLWNKSIARCWSFGLGSRTCQLSHRAHQGLFAHYSFLSVYPSVVASFNCDFGEIHLPLSGQGTLWYKRRFVLQRHTLPISRTDAMEASTFFGYLLRDITSMYHSRLQSYGGFSNISLSMTFTLFPFISLYFTGS